MTNNHRKSRICKEHWWKAYWRPTMAWLYMAICLCDFILFPIATMIILPSLKIDYVAWKPITLDNGGIVHFAFGAILGVAAWSRGREKMFFNNGTEDGSPESSENNDDSSSDSEEEFSAPTEEDRIKAGDPPPPSKILTRSDD